jgi:hypothetical protein
MQSVSQLNFEAAEVAALMVDLLVDTTHIATSFWQDQIGNSFTNESMPGNTVSSHAAHERTRTIAYFLAWVDAHQKSRRTARGHRTRYQQTTRRNYPESRTPGRAPY